jgi:hypothetical protein
VNNFVATRNWYGLGKLSGSPVPGNVFWVIADSVNKQGNAHQASLMAYASAAPNAPKPM